MRDFSPAEERLGLDPAAVDAVADELHALLCVLLAGPQRTFTPEHREVDKAAARFLLLGLRQCGWSVEKIQRAGS